MRPDEKREFVALVTDAMAYYRQATSEFTLAVWSQACQAYTLEQVRKAMTAHAMDPDRGQYPPKVADIVRQLSGTTTDRAALAWGKALEAMQRVGAYTDVVFDDPAIHACIEDLGGWPKVCRAETKDLGYMQHRFCESHRAYTGRGQFEYPRRLIGDRSPDEAYARKGIKPPSPALIGDPERARQVFGRGQVGFKTRIEYLALESLSAAPVEAGV